MQKGALSSMRCRRWPNAFWILHPMIHALVTKCLTIWTAENVCTKALMEGSSCVVSVHLVSKTSVAKSSSGLAASLRTVCAPRMNRRTCQQQHRTLPRFICLTGPSQPCPITFIACLQPAELLQGRWNVLHICAAHGEEHVSSLSARV